MLKLVKTHFFYLTSAFYNYWWDLLRRWEVEVVDLGTGLPANVAPTLIGFGGRRQSTENRYVNLSWDFGTDRNWNVESVTVDVDIDAWTELKPRFQYTVRLLTDWYNRYNERRTNLHKVTLNGIKLWNWVVNWKKQGFLNVDERCKMISIIKDKLRNRRGDSHDDKGKSDLLTFFFVPRLINELKSCVNTSL